MKRKGFFFLSFFFLVACYATQQPALSVRRSIHRSVRRSVTLYFFGFLWSLASQLLPKCLIDIEYSPCPPASDWNSRVSGLVLFLFLFRFLLFLFSPVLRDSTPRFVSPSVGPSVRPSVHHTLLFCLFFFCFFFAVFSLTAPVQMMKRPIIWPLPTRTRLW